MEAGAAVNDMAVIGVSASLLSMLFLLWAIAGIIKPAVLFFALPELRTRKHAFCFPLSGSMACFFITLAAAATDERDWFAWIIWIIAGVLAFLTLRYYLDLRRHKPREKEQTEASVLQNKYVLPPEKRRYKNR